MIRQHERFRVSKILCIKWPRWCESPPGKTLDISHRDRVCSWRLGRIRRGSPWLWSLSPRSRRRKTMRRARCRRGLLFRRPQPWGPLCSSTAASRSPALSRTTRTAQEGCQRWPVLSTHEERKRTLESNNQGRRRIGHEQSIAYLSTNQCKYSE